MWTVLSLWSLYRRVVETSRRPIPLTGFNVEFVKAMAKMAAAKKARGLSDRDKVKPVVQKIEDAVEIVKYPPVFSPDSKYLFFRTV